MLDLLCLEYFLYKKNIGQGFFSWLLIAVYTLCNISVYCHFAETIFLVSLEEPICMSCIRYERDPRIQSIENNSRYMVGTRGGQNQIAIWLNQIQSPFFGLGDLIWFDFGDTLISVDFDLIRFSKIFFHAWFDLIWFWKPCWFSQNHTKSHKIMKVNFWKISMYW